MTHDPIRQLAKEAGISEERTETFLSVMDLVDAVNRGDQPPPGGDGCAFPNCACTIGEAETCRKTGRVMFGE